MARSGPHRKVHLAWAALPSLALLLFACGSSTSGGSTGGGGSTSAACTIPSGTYTQHFSAEGDAASCPPLPDQTITMNGTTTFSGFGGASGVNGGPGCTSSYEAETCTMTMSCEMAAGAYTNQFTFNLTFMGTSATGEATITLTDASGQVVSDCTYDIAMTRS